MTQEQSLAEYKLRKAKDEWICSHNARNPFWQHYLSKQEWEDRRLKEISTWQQLNTTRSEWLGIRTDNT